MGGPSFGKGWVAAQLATRVVMVTNAESGDGVYSENRIPRAALDEVVTTVHRRHCRAVSGIDPGDRIPIRLPAQAYFRISAMPFFARGERGCPEKACRPFPTTFTPGESSGARLPGTHDAGIDSLSEGIEAEAREDA